MQLKCNKKKISDLVHQKSPNTKELFPSQNITSPDKKPLEFCIQLNDQLVVAFLEHAIKISQSMATIYTLLSIFMFLLKLAGTFTEQWIILGFLTFIQDSSLLWNSLVIKL